MPQSEACARTGLMKNDLNLSRAVTSTDAAGKTITAHEQLLYVVPRIFHFFIAFAEALVLK